MNILVSGASGIVGYGILRSLKKAGKYKLIGTSIYNDSIAPVFCDIFEQAVKTSDPLYIDWLIGVIQKHNVDMIIPGIDDDMYKWNDNREYIGEQGAVIVLLNDYDLIELCRNKYTFYLRLAGSCPNYAIPSCISRDFDKLAYTLGLPFLLKPLHGFGSKGIVRIPDAVIFDLWEDKIGDKLMAQQIVGSDDEEYTSAVIGDGIGGYHTSITLKRKLSKDGYTDRAEVVMDFPQINQALKVLCAEFKPFGATNFQFRAHEGALKLLEINPRISSSTSIRAAFGYNESCMAVDHRIGKTLVQPQITPGKAIRYTEDYIFETVKQSKP